jgi:hypothetical protein
VEQLKMLSEVKERLSDVDREGQRKEEIIMEKLREFMIGCAARQEQKVENDR